ncbi:protoporphyrinogen oxidase HemJ [Helicobacter sp. MIT 14-3879]|uniref:protoporphyrinogen oxidase HemJ n=1 Tax=Helicobacter sp. MIT 14-3879 TaxID=2040649 RepID=UPI000E1EEE17|nr:protoporphyrinogen oxidase HemJ [Helicobacter sp. MIT 14-3879]RDU65453.1 protoporphyrinogen oxidase HemJ [Helicobacter sp. MIT 14-3879]
MEYYNYIKALHIVAFVSWMAVLFYLPRLFVYHIENKDKKDFVDVVKIQESKLYYFIGTPSVIITVITGLIMIFSNLALFRSGGWLHIKLLFALFLIMYHIDCGRHLKNLKNNIYNKSSKFFRIYNEFPTICLFVIAFCAVLKF